MKRYIIGILLIIITTLMLPCTFSWFIFSYSKSTTVSAAQTSDIIECIDILETNPEFIKIKKADNIKYNPIIYFGVEGEIKDYIIHINPIILEQEERVVPLEIVFGPRQILNLLGDGEVITGTIKIKHLNEFVDVSKKITFTKEYLLEKLLIQIKNCQKNLDEQKIYKIKDYLEKNNLL